MPRTESFTPLRKALVQLSEERRQRSGRFEYWSATPGQLPGPVAQLSGRFRDLSTRQKQRHEHSVQLVSSARSGFRPKNNCFRAFAQPLETSVQAPQTLARSPAELPKEEGWRELPARPSTVTRLTPCNPPSVTVANPAGSVNSLRRSSSARPTYHQRPAARTKPCSSARPRPSPSPPAGRTRSRIAGDETTTQTPFSWERLRGRDPYRFAMAARTRQCVRSVWAHLSFLQEGLVAEKGRAGVPPARRARQREPFLALLREVGQADACPTFHPPPLRTSPGPCRKLRCARFVFSNQSAVDAAARSKDSRRSISYASHPTRAPFRF